MGDPAEKKQVRITMPTTTLTEIDSVSKEIHENNASGVLFRAWKLYKVALRTIRNGGSIVVRDKDGKDTEIPKDLI